MRKLKLEELNRISPAEFKERSKAPLVIVLDNIRSALNVGSAFRTADAFALQCLILCGITAKPPHREILKSAIGATESVRWEYRESIQETIEDLKEKGYFCVAVEQTTSAVDLRSFNPSEEPLALILGNEVDGVSSSILPLIDASLEVPQFGTKHSLNVSVCLGIVVWDVLSKVGFPE